MLRRTILTTAVLATTLSLVATPAFAKGKKGADAGAEKTEKKEEKKSPTVTMGGLLFANYGLDLSEVDSDGDGNNDHYNAFNLERAYLFAKADINENFAARITVDADRQKAATVGIGTDENGNPMTVTVPADTKTRVFVKHAYLEWKTVGKGVKARFGMTDTAWAPYYDSFLGVRYLGKSPSDSAGFVSTSDLGVQFMGEHAKGLVSWQAGVINGEGYANPEVDASKTFQGRVSVDPLAQGGSMNLPISAFFSQSVGDSGDPITLYSGALGFKMKYLAAWGEYDGKKMGDLSASVISVAAIPKVPDVGFAILRFDRVDPSADATDDESTTIIGGLGHDFYERISLAATYERKTLAFAPDLPVHGVYLRAQAGF